MTDGQGEIRTLDTLAGMPVFETGAFNHSATCPALEKYRVTATRTTRVHYQMSDL